jgi:hypothetical protein
MIRIDCHGGQIGRFWWKNSDRGGFFRQSGESCTSFRPGRCGWDEAWPERYSWPVGPWGKGDAVDDHFRDFAAFEPWFYRQLDARNLDEHDLTITDKIELYSLLCDVFKAGIDAGRNPWSWAEHVEQQQTQFQEEQ